MGPECGANLCDHTVIKLVLAEVDSSELFLVVDAFAERLAKSIGELVLTDI